MVAANNRGFGNDMWAAVVNRDGEVCAVVFTGGDRDDQWPGSRVISAQKANTANSFNLDGLAISTANLYPLVQPGASLFGLADSNPVAGGGQISEAHGFGDRRRRSRTRAAKQFRSAKTPTWSEESRR